MLTSWPGVALLMDSQLRIFCLTLAIIIVGAYHILSSSSSSSHFCKCGGGGKTNKYLYFLLERYKRGEKGLKAHAPSRFPIQTETSGLWGWGSGWETHQAISPRLVSRTLIMKWNEDDPWFGLASTLVKFVLMIIIIFVGNKQKERKKERVKLEMGREPTQRGKEKESNSFTFEFISIGSGLKSDAMVLTLFIKLMGQNKWPQFFPFPIIIIIPI